MDSRSPPPPVLPSTEDGARFYASLLDAAGEAIIATDVAGHVTYANAAAGLLYGWPVEELVGRHIAEVNVPDEAVEDAAFVLDELRAGRPWTGEFTVRTRGGRRFPAQVTNTPLLDVHGELVGIIGISRDVSDRRETERRLAESERWFRALVANSSDLVLVVDAQGRQLYASPACEDLLGYAQREHQGEDLLLLVDPDDRVAVREALTRPSELQEPLVFRSLAADGSWLTLEAVANDCLDDPAVAGIVINARDVTASQAATEALRRSESLLRGAERIAHVGHWEYELATDRLAWFAEEIFHIHGLPVGHPPADRAAYLELVVEEDRFVVDDHLRDLLERGRSSVQYRILRPDGALRVVQTEAELLAGTDVPGHVVGTCQDITERVATSMALQERVKELTALATISGGAHELTDVEELGRLAASSLLDALQDPARARVDVVVDGRSWRADGEGFRPPARRDSAAPIRVGGVERGRVTLHHLDAEGFLPEEEALARSVAETLGLWLDRYRATEALRQAYDALNDANEQLSAGAQLKDDLLSMASHELRTPLTPVLGFLEILEERGDNLTEDQRRMLQIMRRNTKRMLRLVDDLLVVSRATADVLISRPEEVDAHEHLFPVLEELGEWLTAIRLDLEGCRLVVDPQHLQQIVLNLLTNAIKYGAAPIEIAASDAGHGRVLLEVADGGPGVPVEFQPRMWDRFAQKDRGDTRTAMGAGLGLAIVKLLAETNGGSVGYRDRTPTGAVFTVELPGQLEPPPRKETAAPDAAPRPGRPGRALGGAPSAASATDGPRPRSPLPRQPGSGSGSGERPAATALRAPPLPDEPTGSGPTDPEHVMGWATRQLLHVESRDDAAGVVLRVIQRLGGWTTPARLADDRSMPLDVSFGLSEPILPAAPPQSIERLLLERHLPVLMEDARRAVDLLGNVERLHRDATVDPLTGLTNRRGISRLLSRGLQGASLVVFDLDGFKAINDRHGHGAGDQLLQEFAACLQRQLRAGDHAGRHGGDEFVAILPDTDEEGARRLVDRLLQAWEALRSHAVGVSAGIASIGFDGGDAIERADAAMYRDKAARRRPRP